MKINANSALNSEPQILLICFNTLTVD